MCFWLFDNPVKVKVKHSWVNVYYGFITQVPLAEVHLSSVYTCLHQHTFLQHLF